MAMARTQLIGARVATVEEAGTPMFSAVAPDEISSMEAIIY